jgi:uncharacterized protein YbjT (DUF2867 family)
MTSTILVTGGTGVLGRLVTPRLLDEGFKVRVLSRSPRDPADGIEFVTGDLHTGEGVQAAVEGADTVLHLAGSAKGDADKARTLVRAASRAGSPHLIYISVVGAERVPVTSRVDRAMFGYFEAKRAAERIIEDSGLPWTTLRASQFYELILQVAQALVKMPVVPSFAGVRVQPVDSGEVAARLVELALGKPSGYVPDMAGPRIHGMKEMLRDYLDAIGKRRPIVSVPLPGKAARAFRDGANLAPDHATGHRTWEDFLAAHVR